MRSKRLELLETRPVDPGHDVSIKPATAGKNAFKQKVENHVCQATTRPGATPGSHKTAVLGYVEPSVDMGLTGEGPKKRWAILPENRFLRDMPLKGLHVFPLKL